MQVDLTAGKGYFTAALVRLGATQREVAELAGYPGRSISELWAGDRSDKSLIAFLTDICRGGLMVKAALLGREDAELMKYTEHAIFGLPKVAAEVAVPEARERADEIRRAKAEMRRAS
jgi:transcriptional regulator with XRE-family HTH domain